MATCMQADDYLLVSNRPKYGSIIFQAVRAVSGNYSLELSGNSVMLNGKPVEGLDKGVEVPLDKENYTFR